MLNLSISKESIKFLETLPSKHFLQIERKIDQLRLNPLHPGHILLKGNDEEKYYRVKSGEYRIIYGFDKKTLLIFAIGKRNDKAVYKSFSRQLSQKIKNSQ